MMIKKQIFPILALASASARRALAPIILAMCLSLPAYGNDFWKYEWPDTNFENTHIDLKEILSGGPSKDGIPSIDNPIFEAADQINDIGPKEPVISIEINEDARSYPVRILMFHEIVNDVVGGVPVAITYCPLCNAALVFERTVNGQVLEFGTTGKLRYSDMIMYDRQTESWWQQFTGLGIVGKHDLTQLRSLPSRFEAFSLFQTRHPKGKVLVPNNPQARPYGTNPYTQYDSAEWPFLYRGAHESDVEPLERVVAVGDDAWPLSLLSAVGEIQHQGITISWQSGQNSALDQRIIEQSKDVGTVQVQKDGQDMVYHLPFAFAFLAFNKNGVLHQEVKNE